MTKEELKNAVELKQELDFKFNGNKYCITYGREPNGKPYIAFGQQYDQPVRYAALQELLLHAKIGNHFLREILDQLTSV